MLAAQLWLEGRSVIVRRCCSLVRFCSPLNRPSEIVSKETLAGGMKSDLILAIRTSIISCGHVLPHKVARHAGGCAGYLARDSNRRQFLSVSVQNIPTRNRRVHHV